MSKNKKTGSGNHFSYHTESQDFDGKTAGRNEIPKNDESPTCLGYLIGCCGTGIVEKPEAKSLGNKSNIISTQPS